VREIRTHVLQVTQLRFRPPDHLVVKTCKVKEYSRRILRSTAEGS
jgi:hypothetical protein